MVNHVLCIIIKEPSYYRDAFESRMGVAVLRNSKGGLDYSEMMKRHNVGDTARLTLPDMPLPPINEYVLPFEFIHSIHLYVFSEVRIITTGMYCYQNTIRNCKLSNNDNK